MTRGEACVPRHRAAGAGGARGDRRRSSPTTGSRARRSTARTTWREELVDGPQQRRGRPARGARGRAREAAERRRRAARRAPAAALRADDRRRRCAAAIDAALPRGRRRWSATPLDDAAVRRGAGRARPGRWRRSRPRAARTSASCCGSSCFSRALLLALGGGTAFALSRHRRALERLAHQHAAILESVGDGIVTIDRDGRIVYANPRRRAINRADAPVGRRSRRAGSPAAATLQDGRTARVARAAVARARTAREALVDYTVTPLRDGDAIEGRDVRLPRRLRPRARAAPHRGRARREPRAGRGHERRERVRGPRARGRRRRSAGAS